MARPRNSQPRRRVRSAQNGKAGVPAARQPDASGKGRVCARSLWRPLLAVFAIALAAGTLAAVFIAGHWTQIDDQQQARQHVNTLLRDIEPDFAEVINALNGAASTHALQATAQGQTPRDDPRAMLALDIVKSVCQASIVYLMDLDGLTVACTPYGPAGEASLTGLSYAFRPYFADVVESGKPCIYGALGVTTGQRGLYVAVPVTSDPGRIVGVAVAKISADRMSNILANQDNPCAVLTSEGIVFATNRREWLYQAAYPLTASQRQDVVASRQFADQPLRPLPVNLQAGEIDINGGTYRVTRDAIIRKGWTLVYASPKKTMDALLLGELLMVVILVVGGSGGAVIYVVSRREYRLSLQAQQQEVLRTAERFRSLVEGSPNHIATFDKDGRYLSINAAGLKTMGWVEADILGKPFVDIWPQAARTQIEQAIQNVLADEHASFEATCLRADGTAVTWWGNLSPIPPCETSPERFSCIAADISDHKQVEEHLRRSEERLALATEGTGIGVWDYHLKENRLEWDERMCALFGIEPADFSGRFEDWASRVVPEALPQALDDLERAIHGDEEFRIEFPIRRPDGEIRWLAGAAAVTRNAAGEAVRAVGINFDITDRKRAEQLLRDEQQRLDEAITYARHMASEAARANAAKSEFLANMSHEIRTPMNGIIGMAGLLEDTPLNADQQELLDTVRTCSEQLLVLINEILDLSKIEAGKFEIESIDFDLAECISKASDIVATRARQKQLAFTCHLDPNVPTLLRGDPGRLRQIVINLANNAVKFTASGQVDIQATLQDQDAETATVRFDVRDTGIGIAADKLKRIFEPFSQLDASTTRKFGGTGLGLAISKQLAELMGGHIGVESTEGKGSRFWFTAVLQKQPAGTPARPSDEPEASQDLALPEGIRVLLAEDNLVNQRVAMVFLERKLGISADLVTNGAEALDALCENDYDLVLMDCQMPTMDGFEATRHIRDPESGVRDPGVPIVALTANAMKGDRDECLAAGMDDYVSKPIKLDELRAAIRRALALRDRHTAADRRDP